MIGVDLGGTKVLAGVIDDELRVHARAQRTVPNDDQERILGALVDAVEEVRVRAPRLRRSPSASAFPA